MYYEKYMKYKKKYELLKNNSINIAQTGGNYNNLVYLGQGAESFVFKTEDGKAIKIIKNVAKRINPVEKEVMQRVSDLESPHFPKVHAMGICKNRTELTRDSTDFCIGSDGSYEYEYILMDIVNGNDMMTLFYKKFKTHLNKVFIDIEDDDINMKVEEFSQLLMDVIIQLAHVLKSSSDAIGFRHSDFNYGNCIINRENVPVIIDFGQSSLGQAGILECSDLIGFFKSIVNGLNCGSRETLSKVFPKLKEEGSEEPKRLIIKKNCEEIMKKVKAHKKIKEVVSLSQTCVPYTNSDIPFSTQISRLEAINRL